MSVQTWTLLAFTLWAFVLAGCKKTPDPHVHADEHVEGHDHHAKGHGHEVPVQAFTLWNDEYELFGEYSPPSDQSANLLVHLTHLADFSPLSDKRVDLVWTQHGETHTTALTQRQPGIFGAELPSTEPEPFQAKLLVDDQELVWPAVHGAQITLGKDGGSLHDHAHPGQAHPDDDHEGPHDDHHDHGEIELLKEQQWNIPFATAFVQEGSLEPTKEVLGHVEIPPSSIAQVSAPMQGKILQPKGGFPNPGQQVKAGQILAFVAPTLQSADQLAKLKLALAQSNTVLDGARSELARYQRLVAQQAASQRDLEAAQRNFAKAEQAKRTALQTLSIFERGDKNSLPVRSPMEGVLTDINVRLGELAAMGQILFRVSNTQTTWLRVHVPVQWMAKLDKRGPIYVRDDASGAWSEYQVVSSAETAGRATLLNIAVEADRNTQIVDVLYAVQTPQSPWLVGASKRILISVGKPMVGLIIPRSALIVNRGIHKVYVQVDGEHFVERTVNVVQQQGDRVLISRGLAKGERVVVTGGAVVGLAANTDATMGHGHLH